MIEVGVLGSSEGNGHPFSFSAIINGFDSEAMCKAGWPGIARYLSQHTMPCSTDLSGARVTSVWCPDVSESALLCEATRINRIVEHPRDMVDVVDAVMILRDDWVSHLPLARPFLRRGIPVFVDKPLTLSRKELPELRGFLNDGQLMSCSGLRFAPELSALGDCVQQQQRQGQYVRAVVPKDLGRYGIHIIEMISALAPNAHWELVGVNRERTIGVDYRYVVDSSLSVQIVCSPSPNQAIDISFGDDLEGRSLVLTDFYEAFRRTIGAFIDMVKSGRPPIDPSSTERILETTIRGLSAAVASQQGLDS